MAAKLNLNLAVVLIAVAIVAGSFATSQTGFATASPYDFTITSITAPASISTNLDSVFTANVENLGTTTASAVAYKYEVVNSLGYLVFQNNGKINLPAGLTEIALPVDVLKAGTYTLKMAVDTEGVFTETSKSNNNYELEVTVPY
ncbi:MAG: CARDB domain-containing protein [Nanoarchaeota archaeon]